MEEELKENVPQEEKVEQKPEEDINSQLPSGEPIAKPTPETEDYGQTIENARLDFSKAYRASRRNSFIAMGVVMAFAVGAVICIGQAGMVWKITGWALIGTALLGMIIYYIVTHNAMPNATKEYIKVVNDNLNMRNFADTQFQDVTVDKNEKIELSDPVSDAIYKDLTNIASRNVVNGHFAGRSFKVADLGLYSGAGRNRVSAFVGKYFSYPNDLHFEGRYILLEKGPTPVDLPSDIDDLKPLVEEGNFVIYGPEGGKPASDLGDSLIKEIRKLKVQNHLLGYSLVFWSGHTSGYLSYDDAIMALPFEKKFDKEPNEQYANDLLHLFNCLKQTVKKEK